MSTSLGASEHWTVTGERVVITGSEQEIHAIVADVGIAHDTVIRLGGSRAAVALWGPALKRYLSTHPNALHGNARSADEPADILLYSSVV